MALNLPNELPPSAAGYAADAMQGFNALSKQRLENKLLELQNQYYGPNIESVISNRNALTNKTNTLTPLEAEHIKQQNQIYLPQIQAQIAHLNALTKGQDIENLSLPEKLQLAMEHQRQINQFYPSVQQSKLQEQELATKYPLLKMPGTAGQIGAQLYLRDQPGLNQYSDTIGKSIESNMRSKDAEASLNDIRKKGYDWGQLTAEVKNNLTEQGLGMGIDPLKMKKYVNDGLNLKEIAEKEGLDPDNLPPPITMPTTTTKTRVQQQNQISAELDYISSRLTQAIKPYAKTFFGKSTKALTDMMSDDPKKQKDFGEYIGALALQNELASGRLNLAGARSSVELIRDLKNKSLAGIDQLSPIRMTDVAFNASQDFIDKILQKGVKIRTLTGMSPFSHTKTEKESSISDNNDPLGIR